MMRLRRVRADDAERVQQFVRALSARSRLERFLAPVSELSARQLERITSGAGLCLAVFDEHGGIVALGEYACADAAGAELALAVADAWQGRGLGERLLARLLLHARRADIRRLGGVTRAGNVAMQQLARKLGFRLRRDADPCLMRFERLVAG